MEPFHIACKSVKDNRNCGGNNVELDLTSTVGTSGAFSFLQNVSWFQTLGARPSDSRGLLVNRPKTLTPLTTHNLAPTWPQLGPLWAPISPKHRPKMTPSWPLISSKLAPYRPNLYPQLTQNRTPGAPEFS